MARKIQLSLASSLVVALAAAAFFWPVALQAQAQPVCNYPLFVERQGADANVILLFDNSGSMNEALYHDDFDANNPYSGSFTSTRMYYVGSDGTYSAQDFSSKFMASPSANLVDSDGGQDGRYIGNYLNWIFYHADDNQRGQVPTVTRIQVGKAVLGDVVQRSEAGIGFGLWEFDYDNGGRMVSPVGASTADLVTAIDSRVGNSWTPLAESMWDIAQYLEGGSSPIEYRCQTTFLIVVTDGFPTMDRDNGLSAGVGDQDGDGSEPGSCASIGAPYPESNECSDYMDDVAFYLANNDLSDLNGTQNCVTYTVGFNIDAGILAETADNGTGLYFSANSADELWSSLSAALNDIISRKSSGTAAAVVSTETQTDNRLYRARFKPGTWVGFLEAYALPYVEGEAPVWRAENKLANKDAAKRQIYTSTSGTNKVVFDTPNLATIKPFLGDGVDDAYANDIISYHRGIDMEGYRDRDGARLGDIIDSSPVVVGKPSFFFDHDDYEVFRTDNAAREELVYTASNDGMLHAFRTLNGQEYWAYIPRAVLPRLTELMDPGYCHDFYVNGTPKVFDARVGNEWKTVLICGQREGGNSLFALDVTNPAPGQMKVMWDIDMPIPYDTWNAVEVGRVKGYDNFLAFVPSGPDDVNGYSQLFVMDIADGSLVWSDLLGSGSGMNFSTSPSLIDIDYDGYHDLAYVGDQDGDIWRIDLRENPFKISKLFDGSQPITAQPTLTTTDKGHTMVFFGTGRYMLKDDPDNLEEQAFYGVIDNHSGATRDSNDLVNQTSNVTPITATDFGWFINLPTDGERVTREAALVAGTLYFTSFQPLTGTCQFGGNSWLWTIDYWDGSNPDNDDLSEYDGTDERREGLGAGIYSEPIVDLANEDIIIQSSQSDVLVRDTKGTIQRVVVRSWRQLFE